MSLQHWLAIHIVTELRCATACSREFFDWTTLECFKENQHKTHKGSDKIVSLSVGQRMSLLDVQTDQMALIFEIHKEEPTLAGKWLPGY